MPSPARASSNAHRNRVSRGLRSPAKRRVSHGLTRTPRFEGFDYCCVIAFISGDLPPRALSTARLLPVSALLVAINWPGAIALDRGAALDILTWFQPSRPPAFDYGIIRAVSGATENTDNFVIMDP
jgi:hypothetical protein